MEYTRMLMEPLTELSQAQPDTTYPLKRATEILDVDLKTLRKGMRHLEINPARDTADGRVRLLTRDQILELAQYLAPRHKHLTASEEAKPSAASVAVAMRI